MTDDAGVDVAALVAAFRDGPLATYPDLAFLDASGVLSLALDLQGVSSVRIELDDTEFLNLHSILVEGDGATAPAVDLATCRTSSAWPGLPPEITDRTVFDPGDGHGTALHTEREERPWAEIVFSEPVHLRRLVLRNVHTQTAARARNLRVLVDGEVRYDARERRAAFAASVEAWRTYAPALAAPAARELAVVLTKIATLDYHGAHEGLKAVAGVTRAERSLFRSLCNEALLYPRRIEWTVHGIKRSFRFWSGHERRDYLAFALEVIRDLGEISPAVSLGFGSVLGVVRDGGFIPHDDDLDIIIGFEQSDVPRIADGLDLIDMYLSALGYEVSGRHMAHCWVGRPGQLHVDVFVGLFEGDDVSWYPGKRGSLTRDLMFPVSRARVLDLECPLPRNPLEYLDVLYGKSWRTPDPGHAHAWNQKPYADLA
ncbi:LicD family protein [Beutenbergia cavernae DSM 12333]|uniref:LicD family protein n=1 Tax=Beutenbergia cavernae (strain ATCC BAA-8 / DSM 12333 / CCUG 43141 / JCM 11478 / NBRC 16432 / NCIMB 13614 / HKI 0122) TaxID=471853 RepID=C5C158_BEUC1|nr:LicD family protein [Beutenbergia cavernae]ACQ79462.1 LicD family protein [Beutenbergia cavernae DSM 12333]